MAEAWEPPRVSWPDLLEFHAAHLEITEEPAEDAVVDPELGFYPDGTPRTLTDAEIAIFRHSEIQQLLHQRRRAAAAASPSLHAESGEVSEGEVHSTEHEVSVPSDASTAQHTGKALNLNHGGKPAVVQEEGECSDDDEEAEYEAFLERERQEFARMTQRQRAKQMRSYEEADRTISTRRRVREMDACEDATQALTYDEDLDAAHGSDQRSQHLSQDNTAGRKIWWPQIQIKTSSES